VPFKPYLLVLRNLTRSQTYALSSANATVSCPDGVSFKFATAEGPRWGHYPCWRSLMCPRLAACAPCSSSFLSVRVHFVSACPFPSNGTSLSSGQFPRLVYRRGGAPPTVSASPAGKAQRQAVCNFAPASFVGCAARAWHALQAPAVSSVASVSEKGAGQLVAFGCHVLLFWERQVTKAAGCHRTLAQFGAGALCQLFLPRLLADIGFVVSHSPKLCLVRLFAPFLPHSWPTLRPLLSVLAVTPVRLSWRCYIVGIVSTDKWLLWMK
jgi:hypothetical protein